MGPRLGPRGPHLKRSILLLQPTFFHFTGMGPRLDLLGRHVSLVFCIYSQAISILRLRGRNMACGGGLSGLQSVF